MKEKSSLVGNCGYGRAHWGPSFSYSTSPHKRKKTSGFTGVDSDDLAESAEVPIFPEAVEGCRRSPLTAHRQQSIGVSGIVRRTEVRHYNKILMDRAVFQPMGGKARSR